MTERDTARPPVDPRPDETPALRRLRGLARVMDASVRVPGTDFRFGLDAVIGLVPGVGDVLGAIVSGYIVLESARIGASGSTLLRMLGNIGMEALVGAVPALGDVFDAAFRANVRNVRLLEDHVAHPAEMTRRSRGVLVALGAGVVLAVGALAALSLWVAIALLRLLTG